MFRFKPHQTKPVRSWHGFKVSCSPARSTRRCGFIAPIYFNVQAVIVTPLPMCLFNIERLGAKGSFFLRGRRGGMGCRVSAVPAGDSIMWRRTERPTNTKSRETSGSGSGSETNSKRNVSLRMVYHACVLVCCWFFFCTWTHSSGLDSAVREWVIIHPLNGYTASERVIYHSSSSSGSSSHHECATVVDRAGRPQELKVQ